MHPLKKQQKTLDAQRSAFISNRIHGLNRTNDPNALREKLLEIAKAQGHVKPDNDFPRFHEKSYFRILREWNEPTDDPSITGRRMVEVQCICGTMMMLPYRVVNQFYKTSCGCKKESVEQKIETNRKHYPRLPRRMEDLRTSGPNHDGVHGYLKIMSWFKKHEKIYWDVDCVCGKRFHLTRDGFFHKQIDTCGSTQCKSLKAQGYTRDQAFKMFKAARRLAL